ncbi:MAG: hypothetical protein JST94_02940 [Bacteroidetes bacterium]|nr:hypothetical protein [Bacteroidota bacterium]MBS1670398.1 hypothetical protein [Bacteroidota bacterium]
MQPFTIQIIPFKKVDEQKWDEVIAKHNGLIYSTYTYLNTICNNCYAVIVNNYEAVMALPVKRKWGIQYIYTPPFTQQLGIIGNINNELCLQVIQHIKKHFKYGDVFLNHQNNFIEHEANVTLRNNYVIDLSKGYNNVKNKYHASVAQSLQKAKKLGCTYVLLESIEETISLYKQYNKKNLAHLTNNDYEKFTQLIKTFTARLNVFARQVITENKELLSSVILLKDKNRFYNIQNYTSPKGREVNANYFLYNCLFEELQNEGIPIFDFEGSNIEGVKKFYEKFGAINQPYYHWHFNNLSHLLKLFKQ